MPCLNGDMVIRSPGWRMKTGYRPLGNGCLLCSNPYPTTALYLRYIRHGGKDGVAGHQSGGQVTAEMFRIILIPPGTRRGLFILNCSPRLIGLPNAKYNPHRTNENIGNGW